MVSTKRFGGLVITIGGGGLRFKKRKSQFNIKVGQCMKASGARPTDGGRYDRRFQGQFVKCVIEAGANVSAAKRAAFRL